MALQIGRDQQRPLVGRDREREILRRCLFETAQCLSISSPDGSNLAHDRWEMPPRPSFVLLEGEAGIGKTRLAEEISREAQQQEWSVAWNRLYAQERSVPYQLWIGILRHIVQQGLWPRQDKETYPLFYQSLTALLPEIADLWLAEEASIEVMIGQEQLRLWDAVLTLLKELSMEKPLLIVLDDLHCADDSSCELLGYLARHLVDYPVLLVGTCRAHELPTSHPLTALVAHMHREHVITTLHITALTEAQIGELVSYVPEPFLQYIQRQAGGNPFFAEELARISHSEEVIKRGEGAGEFHNAKTPFHMKQILPGTIAGVLEQRLRKLSSRCQEFLKHAAVLGSSFTFSTISLMESTGSAPLDEDGLFSVIDEALQARVLTEEGMAENISYHFWHPLLISHLYEKLSAGRRALLHRRAAQALQYVYAAHVSTWPGRSSLSMDWI